MLAIKPDTFILKTQEINFMTLCIKEKLLVILKKSVK